MSFEEGYSGVTDQGIKYSVVKQLNENSFVVRLNKDKMESHKLVSMEDLKNKKLFFEEDFLIGDNSDSKRPNKGSARARP